jgi:hypothetical protein
LGRKVDVLAFVGARPTGSQLLQQDLLRPLEGGQVCVGVQKLAQRWLIEFLTIRGSMKYKPDRGCDFMREVRSQALRTESDVYAAFMAARSQVANNLRAEDLATDPADERYAGAELLSVVIRPDRTVVLTVEITSAAGTSRKVILPLTVGPGGA